MENQTPLNVLVTGASGQLGRGMMKILQQRGFNVIGLAFSRSSKTLIKCDLTNPEEIIKIIEEEKPDFIVHTAVNRYPDKEGKNSEKTRLLNISASSTIATAAKNIGSKLIHISTDYVFDGTSPPYFPDSKTNPLNTYGQSKLDAEKAIMEADKEGFSMLRIPVLYGPVEYLKESAIVGLFTFLQSSEPVSINHVDRRYPCHVYDIANIVGDLINAMKKDKTLSGIFQWSGLEMLTKYDVMVKMAECFSLDYNHITAEIDVVPCAERPYDCQLDNSRLLSLNISHHTDFKCAIKDILSPWHLQK